MRHFYFLLSLFFVCSCSKAVKKPPFSSVEITTIYEDSLSIRALEIMGGSLAFAANKGIFGTINLSTGKVRENAQTFDTIVPEFRAIAHNATDFFMLSVSNPALLYKTGEDDKMDLVYMEEVGERRLLRCNGFLEQSRRNCNRG